MEKFWGRVEEKGDGMGGCGINFGVEGGMVEGLG